MRQALTKLERDVARAIMRRARSDTNIVRFAVYGLTGLGAAIVSIAQFAEFDASGATPIQVVGIAASLAVLVGAVIVAIASEHSAKELALAYRALDTVRSFFSPLDDAERDIERLLHTRQALQSGRELVEVALARPAASEDILIRAILKATERDLQLALGFAPKSVWTVCVHRAEVNSAGKRELRLLADKRTFPCPAAHARCWEEGTGVGGVVLANGAPMIVPNLQIPSLQAILASPKTPAMPHDLDRYRSMAAYPVIVEGKSEVWGVVSATIDVFNFFSSIENSRIRADEAVKILADLVALAVSASNATRPCDRGPGP